MFNRPFGIIGVYVSKNALINRNVSQQCIIKIGRKLYLWEKAVLKAFSDTKINASTGGDLSDYETKV